MQLGSPQPSGELITEMPRSVKPSGLMGSTGLPWQGVANAFQLPVDVAAFPSTHATTLTESVLSWTLSSIQAAITAADGSSSPVTQVASSPPANIVADHGPSPIGASAGVSPISLASALAAEASPPAEWQARQHLGSMGQPQLSKVPQLPEFALEATAIRSFPPGLLPPEGTPSHGSTLHRSGSCRPCAWFWKADGCKNGRDCAHCHLCPEGEIKHRRKVKQSTIRSCRMVTPVKQSADPFGMRLPSTFSDHSLDLCTPGAGSLFDQASTASPASEHELTPSSDQSSEWEEHDDIDLSRTGSNRLQGGSHSSPLMHGLGYCRPCAWYWKPGGCQRSPTCDFCHLCPDGELKARRKAKHAMMRLGVWGEGSEATDRVPLNLVEIL